MKKPNPARPRRKSRKPRRTAAADARVALTSWWVGIAAVVEEVHFQVTRIQAEATRPGSPIAGLFAEHELREIERQLADVSCAWGSSSPRLPADLGDPLAGLGAVS